MMRLWGILGLLVSVSAVAGPEISEVKISGDAQAVVRFETEGGRLLAPRISVQDNVVKLTFAGAGLIEDLGQKIELNSPHTLIHRASFFESAGKVLGNLVINGSRDNLKERVRVLEDGEGVKITVDFPAGQNPTLALLEKEQEPLSAAVSGGPAPASESRWGTLMMVLVLLALLTGAGVAGYRILARRGGISGTRRYLVETMSYSPLGPSGKAGVALVRVGEEFVLVGVTANQVTMLSDLPGLTRSYQEENQFERDTFRDAVQEEYARLRGRKPVSQEATA